MFMTHNLLMHGSANLLCECVVSGLFANQVWWLSVDV